MLEGQYVYLYGDVEEGGWLTNMILFVVWLRLIRVYENDFLSLRDVNACRVYIVSSVLNNWIRMNEYIYIYT